jgi:hypothetical protein
MVNLCLLVAKRPRASKTSTGSCIGRRMSRGARSSPPAVLFYSLDLVYKKETGKVVRLILPLFYGRDGPYIYFPTTCATYALLQSLLQSLDSLFITSSRTAPRAGERERVRRGRGRTCSTRVSGMQGKHRQSDSWMPESSFQIRSKVSQHRRPFLPKVIRCMLFDRAPPPLDPFRRINAAST